VIQPVFTDAGASQPHVISTRDCEVRGLSGRLPIIQEPMGPNTEVLRLPLENIGADPHIEIMFEVAVWIGLRSGHQVGAFLGRASDKVKEILDAFEADLSSPQALAIRDAADAAHQR